VKFQQAVEQLRRQYYTLDDLLSHPPLAEWFMSVKRLSQDANPGYEEEEPDDESRDVIEA
jgi:hypothetical protein